MKKRLLVLVTLLMIVFMPGYVKASISLENVKNEGQYACESLPKGDKKVTTCDIVYQNVGTSAFNGGKFDLKIIPAVDSTTVEFTVNNSDAKLIEQNGNVYVLNIEPVNAGQIIILGQVRYTADLSLSSEDCGGGYGLDYHQETDDDGVIDDSEITDTGYAIPTIALAVGVIGIFTVIATSKKKTKMYKI